MLDYQGLNSILGVIESPGLCIHMHRGTHEPEHTHITYTPAHTTCARTRTPYALWPQHRPTFFPLFCPSSLFPPPHHLLSSFPPSFPPLSSPFPLCLSLWLFISLCLFLCLSVCLPLSLPSSLPPFPPPTHWQWARQPWTKALETVNQNELLPPPFKLLPLMFVTVTEND